MPSSNQPPSEFRILDKDLSRFANQETARFQAGRPVLRFGVAVLFVATAVLLTLGLWEGQRGLAMICAAVVVCCYLALSIGSNDVANALAPAYAAGAIGLGSGLALMAVAEIAGALLAGQAVTQRVATGIIDIPPGSLDQTPAQVMLAALLAAALWISAASAYRIPVSTTHSIVGAIAGAGMAAFGASAVHWGAMGSIMVSWVFAPLISGVIAAVILAFLRGTAGQSADRVTAGRFILPTLVGTMAGLFMLYLLAFVMQFTPIAAVPAAIVTAALLGWRASRRINQEIRRQSGEQVALKRLMAEPLLWAALLLGFAHGANDVGNVAGPLAVITRNMGFRVTEFEFGGIALLAAGCGVALGALLFGRGLVRMVGGGITRLNPVRALCVTLATAVTVLGASMAALPISTTHVAVGGVFGVGFYREWDDNRRKKSRAPLPDEERNRRVLVRRSYVVTILAAWIVTLPITATLAAILFVALRFTTGA